ncbi:MAG: hypothetical protein GWM90_06815 [Gemmatimonadetes bacterium]|nr:hypothetical protein [Gemmatimonadota bacterium]NIQ53507.1 hypothetical protein [Gemmatimonadota bacterium]NIU73649.1 hypothetical protein [Gammaproteobacteria bacterium]NIX43827.1 hypothetical protein [Gemmatimonadota bacterium]NIY08031.1 hypothetical protein [Gemmatimonadota bacterium]
MLALGLAAPAAGQEALLESCASLEAVADPAIPGGVPAEVTAQFRYLCGQVVDALAVVQPTMGIAFSGGAHTLGTATTIGRRLGAVPRISVTARLNGTFADAPDLLDGFVARLDDAGVLNPMGTADVPIGSFQGDVVVGLFNGIQAGPTLGGFGAIDLLGSLSYLPVVRKVGLGEGIVNAGVGARVGILKQGLVLPGLSVSAMYRTMLGDASFGDLDDPDSDDPAEFTADLSTVSLRAGISKGFLLFDLAAGAGYDIYSSDVAFDWVLVCPAGQCRGDQDVRLGTANGVQGELTTAAWNVHGNVGVSLLLLDIVGEIGYQKATQVVDLGLFQDAGLPPRQPTLDGVEGGSFFGGIGARLTF